MAHEVLHDPAAGLSALERLPPELLTTIFDQIGFTERDYRALQLLFPTILPYVRPHLYRTIYFTSFRVDRYHAPPALLDFWTATEGNPTLAGLVECVHIEDCRAVLLQKEMDAVSRFLKSATALKSLYIDDFPTSFLSPELASTCYRRLETLSFNCTPQGDELRNISLLPNLTLLCLAVDGNVDADESQEQLDEERLASPPLEQGSPAQIPLKHLYMETYWRRSSARSIPSSYESSQSGPTPHGQKQQTAFTNPFPASLPSPATSLTLHIIFTNPEAAQSILTLPLLSTIAIVESESNDDYDLEFALNYSFYHPLLVDPTLLPLLKSLQIPSFRFAIGTNHHTRSDYTPYYSRVDGRVVVAPDWKVPVWPPLGTKEQAKEIVRLAKEKKIVLTTENPWPDLEEAIRRSDRYDEEVIWCAAQPRVQLVD